jgi:hypothetical protein
MKNNILGTKMSQRHLVHHKIRIDSSEIEHVPPQ